MKKFCYRLLQGVKVKGHEQYKSDLARFVSKVYIKENEVVRQGQLLFEVQC